MLSYRFVPRIRFGYGFGSVDSWIFFFPDYDSWRIRAYIYIYICMHYNDLALGRLFKYKFSCSGSQMLKTASAVWLSTNGKMKINKVNIPAKKILPETTGQSLWQSFQPLQSTVPVTPAAAVSLCQRSCLLFPEWKSHWYHIESSLCQCLESTQNWLLKEVLVVENVGRLKYETTIPTFLAQIHADPRVDPWGSGQDP